MCSLSLSLSLSLSSSLSPARFSSLTRRFAMHARVRDVVPRPTRPHGHCQLGVTRIICAIILDNRRYRLVVNEENLHTIPLVTAYMVPPQPPPPPNPLPFAGTVNKRVPHRTIRGGQREKVGNKKMRNCRKGTLIATITPHDIDVPRIHRYQFPLYSP